MLMAGAQAADPKYPAITKEYSMFGMKSKKQPPIRSLIGEGMVVAGNLSFSEGLRVDGEVNGDVCAADDSVHSIVVISENARVNGKVKASHVIINGEIHGPVHCTELLELQPKARVMGDIRYEMLEMHAGAVVGGELKSLRSAVEKPPALKLAASNES
jgi:cytoskeletal protein CcmA (bactofilin family)